MRERSDDSVDWARAKTIEERYAVVTDAMSEGVYDWDLRRNRLDVSARLAEISGFSRTEINADDWTRRIHDDDLKGYRAAVARHFKGQSFRLQCEYRIQRSTGDFIWIADTGRCLRDERGLAVRLVGAIRDITGRKIAEAKLKSARYEAETARANLADALESVSEGLVLFDSDDRVVLCNSHYRSYFAETVGEEIAAMIVPGALFWDFLRAGYQRGMLPIVDQMGGFEAYVEKRKEMRRNPQEPIEQLLSDGRWLQINEHRTQGGGIASVYTEITELKRRETELAAKSEELEALSSQLSKYLAPQVYSTIFSGTGTTAVAARRKKLTVFFSDLVGFTSLVDRMESEELTSILNEYLTEMSAIAFEHGATLDKFIGDAIMAFLGDPVSHGVEADASACVAMGRAMQGRLSELNRRWRQKGLDYDFQLRIGIATGFCTVGNFGSEERLDYTAIGHAVNIASRLQAHADPGGMMLDAETYALVRQHLGPAEELHLSVKGFSDPVRAFSIAPPRESPGDVVGYHAPGADIDIDLGALAGDDRAGLAEALRQALAQIEKFD